MEIPKMESFWDDQLVNSSHVGHRHSNSSTQQTLGTSAPSSGHSPYERNLNFATVAVEDGEYGYPKKKTVRDPLSHRIIEKRRRDRMNNCLADLARLLPPSSLRKGRGRIEKTEIVELAIKHLRHLQCHPCPMGDKCEFSSVTENQSGSGGGVHNNSPPPASISSSSTSSGYHSSHEEQFRLGYQECLSEAMHFLVEQEGLYAGDATCVRLVKHLNTHCDTLLRDRDHWGNQGKIVAGFRRAIQNAAEFNKTGSSSSGYHPNGSSSGSDGNGTNDVEGEATDSFALPVQNPPQQLNPEGSRHSSTVLDFDGENSCSSTPLSTETSDVLSLDGRNTNRPSSKPPIPSIICSHSSSNTSGSPATNGRSSDDGSANSSASFAHRYKFKSNIKQRFTADCQTKSDEGVCYGSVNGEKSGCGEELECDRDGDIASDAEEIREERMSLLEEAMLQSSRRASQSAGNGDLESKTMKQDSCSRPISADVSGDQGCEIGPTNNKPIQPISGNVKPSSPDSSPPDKTAFSLSSTNSNRSSVDAKSSASSSSTTTPLSLENQLDGQSGRARDVEVKPTPEELLTAIHSISSPVGRSNSKTQLPIIIGGETTLLGGEKGVPAFALHEKGLFYIPLTLDKGVVAPYLSKFDSCEAPPLYPVTINVCFLLNSDKRSKIDAILEPDALSSCNDSSINFAQGATSLIPMPMLPAGGSSGKSNRRGHRESNPYLVRSFGHPKITSKEANVVSRIPGIVSGRTNYQAFPENVPSTGPCDLNRGGNGGIENESNSSSGCGRSTTGSGAGGSSSGSSCSASANPSRKRSISSSPSMAGSGGSLGYHSSYDKTPSNPNDFLINFHSNTHNLQVMAMQGHLNAIPPQVGSNGVALASVVGHRNGQSLHAYPIKAALRDDGLAFAHSHEKRSKKARSVDQFLDAK